MGVLAVILIVSGCGDSPVKLAPIAGKWIRRSDQNQNWTYTVCDRSAEPKVVDYRDSSAGLHH